jgi:glyoxylase I family protein
MSAVQHVAMNCRDLRVQERFYTKHFGFRRARVFNAGTPGEFIMLRLDATCLELFQVGAEAKSARGGSPRSVSLTWRLMCRISRRPSPS